MRFLVVGLILALSRPSGFAAGSEVLDHIREHMRQYLGQLPDYTCRITIERSSRRNSHARFDLIDRLRLEIAYSSAQEFYAWPGDNRFSRNIAELLAGHGMVSEGSFALHMRKLFQTRDAEFSEPRPDVNESVRLDFFVPAVRSGFAISAGGNSAPSALRGSVWFDRQSLDVARLEVRVEDTPRSVRIENTREVTSYTKVHIADGEFVLPANSELILRDRDGSEHRNLSRFDHFQHYTASTTIRYGQTDGTETGPAVQETRLAAGTRVVLKLDAPISDDAAIGDLITGSDGTAARITDLHRAGKRWSIELMLVRAGRSPARGVIRRTVSLPVPAGATFAWRTE